MKSARILSIYHMLLNALFYFRYRHPIVITAWVLVRYGRIVPHNWGDDINIYLLELMTGRKVVVKNQSLYHNRYYKGIVYSCIGSIIGWYETNKTIIWGSGMISEDTKLWNKPLKICSVRGEETQKRLQRIGVECPSKYGDPALLLSRYYQASPTGKRYKIGIVPHYMDLNNPLIKQFLDKYENEAILIDLVNYNNWTDIPDKIVSCDFIISSSLHGLIVADSYSIPNAWVSFSDSLAGGDFKFKDYFSSVKRSDYKISISSLQDIENIYASPKRRSNALIDFNGIAASAPFKLKEFNYNEI